MSRLSLVFRSLFLLGFVVVVPLLALPSVTRRLDEALYGDEQDTTDDEPLRSGQAGSASDGRVIPATFETPLAESLPAEGGKSAQRGLDAIAGSPPTLAPLPAFPSGTAAPLAPVAAEIAPQAMDSESAGDSLAVRTGQIRQRLEDLGAEYILLEALEETGEHRFECRMLVAPGSSETETFEATGRDGVRVAEQVLSAVERWRSSQNSLLR